MSAAVDAASNSGTTAVRGGYGFDVARLDRWLTQHVEDYAGPLTVEQFRGGQSNPTYRLDTPGQRYVLRRKPPGALLKGAHAIEREARVLSALAPTGFPVARPMGLCTDETVIGTCFYVMELVEGRIFWDATFPELSRAERPLYFDAMNSTMAQLHAIDPAAVSLTDYGRPDQYLERQIRRWSNQYLADDEAGRDPSMDRLLEWLPAHIPPGDCTAVVHGDFRCDNIIFHPAEPRVLAVLDWELSTLGHPLVDFAYHAMMYHMPPDIVAGLAGSDLAALKIPSEADYVAAYCARTGRDSIPHYDVYIAFNLFRVAAIFHGIKARVIRGTAASEHADARAQAFPRLAALAWAAAERIG